ncbi:MAG: GMC family oxidoreductase, partial [Frankiales bacterium]|nr:GMC family oxidoreductase [Frankiales bacterium]
ELFLSNLGQADQAGIAQLLDGLAMLGFQHQGRATREGMLGTAAALSPEAAIALQTLRGASCLLAHSLPDAQGRNPFWPAYGYPGPAVAPRDEASAITPYAPSDGEVLSCDVVVVGSGAGGGTIAGVLAAQGKRVVVLEAGGASAPRDYRQLEVEASAAMMYRGGLALSADGNIGLLAGATLGGGTTVNWQNCVQPSDAVRQEWAQDFGLTDLATPEFDRHLEAVLARLSATDECSDLNGPHQRMTEGASALGWSVHTAVRNVDKHSYDADLAGYTQFGDPTGSKQSTLVTYLQDAVEHGAQILVHTRADQVCVENGTACGVAATYTDPATGAVARVQIRATDVVVACGALETPALLLRSGIGGPAVGQHLYLHPSAGMFGVYEQDQRAWWGPPQAAVMDEFRDLGDGYGLLIEGSQYYSGVFAFQLARRDGREHKEAMSKLGRMSDLLFILRDHAGGQVTVDAAGEAVHTYSLRDARDEAAFRKGIRVLAELHLAAGAQELWLNTPTAPVFREGDDLETWLATLDAMPIGAGGIAMGSAHQMGTARMGTDPATSVAQPTGELHDVARVWIGDTSAFPTPSGANPMLTCMALAHRTAKNISGRRDESPALQVSLDTVPAA